MAQYRVYMRAWASLSVEVEAEDEEDAIDQAYEEGPGSLCFQCSGWGQKWDVEIGEWEPEEDTPAELREG